MEGFTVTTTLDADSALSEINGSEFDIAIVDLMLPGVNGIELARQLRNRQPSTRVLLTSAYHLSEAQLRKLDCGVIGFLPKPFAIEELAEFLRAKTDAPASSPGSARKKAVNSD